MFLFMCVCYVCKRTTTKIKKQEKLSDLGIFCIHSFDIVTTIIEIQRV